MLTDSHCHLADPAFAGRLPEVLAQAAAAGVRRWVVPSAQADDWPAVLALHRPPQCYAAVGIHPWYADCFGEPQLRQMAACLEAQPQLWVGEIGLDYYGERKQQAGRQQQVLQAQLALAHEYRRPVILHNLRATADLVAALKRRPAVAGGIAHAFSGSLEEAEALIGQGLLIGIGTLVLRESARKARHAAALLPLQHLVLETDSPFMPPDGQDNTPANVRRVAETVAALRGLHWTEVAVATETNFNRLLAAD